MGAISENCSVCSQSFEMQFRYQMEERDGAFSFFCSQKCLEQSHRTAASDAGVACEACAKRFQITLVSQVFFAGGKRHYACSMDCRSQLLREKSGASLGDIAMAQAEVGPIGSEPLKISADATLESGYGADEAHATVSDAITGAPSTSSVANGSPAVAVSISPTPRPSMPSVPPPQTGRPRLMAIFNHKGGTGKTTTSVSLAAGLAARGKRVLLVDTDAQGNVSVSLNASSERSLYHVLVMGLRVADCAKTVRPNLDLLPSNETLAAAELYLAGRQNRDRILRERLSAAANDYDFVILDCSPSLSLMNQNALVFADSVLVPVACDYLSLVGVRQVIKTVKSVNTLLHHPVQIWGVLPTFFDARARICREAIGTMREHFGDRCLPPIRQATRVKEAPSQGQTIFEYAAGSAPAEDYLTVVDRVLAAHEGRSLVPPVAENSISQAVGA